MAINIIPAHYKGISCLLWTGIGCDFNSTSDQKLLKYGDFGSYFLSDIVITNASTSLTTAAGGFYDAASKGGNAVVAASQAYSALTSATVGLKATIAAAGVQLLSAKDLYFALTTGQGGAATADIYVFGRVMT